MVIHLSSLLSVEGASTSFSLVALDISDNMLTRGCMTDLKTVILLENSALICGGAGIRIVMHTDEKSEP
jgi:hypothetical protein